MRTLTGHCGISHMTLYYYSTQKVKKFLLSSPTDGKHQDAISVYFHRRTIVTKNISALQNRYTCYDKNLLSDSARRASKVLVIPFKEEILYKKKEREGKKKRWIKWKLCYNLITLQLPWGLGNLRAHFILRWGRTAQVWCMITEDFKPKIGRLRSRRDILTKVLYSDKRARRWSAIFFL